MNADDQPMWEAILWRCPHCAAAVSDFQAHAEWHKVHQADHARLTEVS